MSVTVKLSRPIEAHGEQVTELVLREPTPEDLMEVGLPFLLHQADGSTGVEVRQKVIGLYVVRLAKVPMSSVKAMALPDFSACQEAILGFFGQGAGEI